MAEKYFALQLNGGIGLSKIHQNCEGVSTVYVLTAEEWEKWQAIYVAAYQQDRDAMFNAVKAINRSTYNATIAEEPT